MMDGSAPTSGATNLNADSMTDESQTRKEAHTSIAELLKPKHKLNIGTGNVRTMYQTGKLAQIVTGATTIRLTYWGSARPGGQAQEKGG